MLMRYEIYLNNLRTSPVHRLNLVRNVMIRLFKFDFLEIIFTYSTSAALSLTYSIRQVVEVSSS